MHRSQDAASSAADSVTATAGGTPVELATGGAAGVGLKAAAVVVLLAAACSAAAQPLLLTSPDGHIRFTLNAGARLEFEASFRGHPFIEKSPLGLLVDGVDLGQHPIIGIVKRYRVNETYDTRGNHSVAVNRASGAHIPVGAAELDVRVSDDGVAFRWIVPGRADQRRTPDAATSFVLPAGSVVWYHDLRGHYEGMHVRREISDVRAGDWAAVPLTFQLPGGAGYGSITESALEDYSGMVLEAGGHADFLERLGHSPPASYPYTLRYGDGEAKRLSQPAVIEGTIRTPWRVVMAARDLNALVNSDLVNNLAPPPDLKLFPQGIHTSWIRPGRSLWRYLDGGDNSFEGMKKYADWAKELGFEYNLLEGFWTRWTPAQLREMVEYSKARGVGLILWKHSRDLRDAAKRKVFFELCRDAGVAGAKIDFFDHEHREVADLYRDLLREAAEYHLVLDFHGANKPTGQTRTWPNELTREGIFGLEHRQPDTVAQHNTTLPFTRMLAGPADYTPMIFSARRKETTWTHQIATAAIFTSPLLVYGAHPQSMLENPAADLIKSIPSVWDETVVLPPSEIGKIAVFARRSGNTWFLAIMNGPAEYRFLRLNLGFLGSGRHQAMLVRDDMDQAAAEKIERTGCSRGDLLEIELRPAGGFVGRFLRTAPSPACGGSGSGCLPSANSRGGDARAIHAVRATHAAGEAVPPALAARVRGAIAAHANGYRASHHGPTRDPSLKKPGRIPDVSPDQGASDRYGRDDAVIREVDRRVWQVLAADCRCTASFQDRPTTAPGRSENHPAKSRKTRTSTLLCVTA